MEHYLLISGTLSVGQLTFGSRVNENNSNTPFLKTSQRTVAEECWAFGSSELQPFPLYILQRRSDTAGVAVIIVRFVNCNL